MKVKKLATASLAALIYGGLTLDQIAVIIGIIIGILNLLLEAIKQLKKRKEEEK